MDSSSGAADYAAVFVPIVGSAFVVIGAVFVFAQMREKPRRPRGGSVRLAEGISADTADLYDSRPELMANGNFEIIRVPEPARAAHVVAHGQRPYVATPQPGQGRRARAQAFSRRVDARKLAASSPLSPGSPNADGYLDNGHFPYDDFEESQAHAQDVNELPAMSTVDRTLGLRRAAIRRGVEENTRCPAQPPDASQALIRPVEQPAPPSATTDMNASRHSNLSNVINARDLVPVASGLDDSFNSIDTDSDANVSIAPNSNHLIGYANHNAKPPTAIKLKLAARRKRAGAMCSMSPEGYNTLGDEDGSGDPLLETTDA